MRLHHRPLARTALGILAALALVAGAARHVHGFNFVVDGNGTWWGIQDGASPFVDTGSVSVTQTGPAQGSALVSTLNGVGGIKVRVQTTPEPRFNGELMRGFGLTFDGHDSFRSTRSVDLGGVIISRIVTVSAANGWGRWLDTFSNHSRRALTLQVAFGGQSGIGAPGASATSGATAVTSSAIVKTSSGDAAVTSADGWVEVATPTDGATVVGGPQVTVLGTPGRAGTAGTAATPGDSRLTFVGDWQRNSFRDPYVAAGHRGNFQAYVHTLTLAPGESQSLLHYLVLGRAVTAATSAEMRLAVEKVASDLVAAPDVEGLKTAEICSIVNFSPEALARHGFRDAACSTLLPTRARTTTGGTAIASAVSVRQPPVPVTPPRQTTARIDVVGKTIAELRAALESGETTSREITQAYLDRIAAYDVGQFGFHAYEVVASDALQQAQASDAARAGGRRGPLLGIPIALKNLYDTVDMPTTNGSRTFEGFRPARDAFQVKRLRDAGAVIIGKAALEEYATSGYYSNDAWGQVWNVFQPSRSALGSSGGSASVVAASLAAAAMGSQTGDSLYAPASGASLVTLRGTDGLESGSGIMPLTYLTDFGGVLARSVSDLADVLNVVVAVDPDDPETSAPGRRVPADWRTLLDRGALRGKRIGFIPSTWIDPFGTTNTIDVEKAALKVLEEAGAQIVEMGVTAGSTDAPPAPDAPTSDIRSEGWRRYIESHPELAAQGFAIRTAADVNCSQKKVPYVRLAAGSCQPVAALTAAQVQAWRDYRRGRQASANAWMDAARVDAVVYPGLLSDISLNDGGGSRASFGRRDTPSAANGIPTVVVPAGVNDSGQPVNIQLLGRAWDDDKLVAMAYAFEQIANATGRGHVEATTAPPLPRVARVRGR